MTIRKPSAITGALGLALVLAGPATAQNAQEQAILQQQCTGDYMRLCSAYDPGGPQVAQCFKARMADLSSGCRAAITEYTKQHPERPARR